ncbi:MAG TPA: hypothetical protein VMF88_11635 [Bacteroidota bacterium]|nr:hypothetical protein [Bacteroidota bacterium]
MDESLDPIAVCFHKWFRRRIEVIVPPIVASQFLSTGFICEKRRWTQRWWRRRGKRQREVEMVMDHEKILGIGIVINKQAALNR